jgi:hypothetical protein
MSSVYITAVEMAGGTKHEHIAYLRWQDAKNDTGWMTREQGVEWLRDERNVALVASTTDPRGYVNVKVVEERPPYLRTIRNGVYTDNLLDLPGGPSGPALPPGWKRR